MTAEPKPTNSSTGTLLALLPRTVAAIVSLSALGYFIGWREAHAYYAALGAAWAVTAVPPLMLLQLSATTIVTVMAACFFSLVLLLDKNISTRTLGRFCAASLGIAGLCLSASQGLFGDISAANAYGLASVGAAFFAISAGVTVTELVGHLRQSSIQTISSGHLWLVYWFVLPGLFWAPDRLGEAQALRDMEGPVSSLPIVDLGPESVPGEWRLVHAHEDKALLIMLATTVDKRLFKVVEAKDVRSIRATFRSVAKP